MERVNLELGQFDVELILKTLKKAYLKTLKEVRVDSHWVRNDMTMEFVSSHTEWVETKESRQLKSTINYIEMQLQKSEK